jgi:hypothetical protein
MHRCYKEHDTGAIISQFNNVVRLMGHTTKIHGGATRNVVHRCVLETTPHGDVVCLI